MYAMFSHCHSLITLNLSSFDVTKVTDMSYMFNNCTKLKYLDISHFSPINMTSIHTMFQNLSSLIFLNIYSLEINTDAKVTNTLRYQKNDLKFCANKYNMKNFLSENNKINNCSDICFQKNIKIDVINNKCINSCKDHGFNYECNNIC